jgi:hypothetical protein
LGIFHSFGCPVYIHVPSEKRTKLEPLAQKGFFMGYSETSKAYRVYIPLQGKNVVNKDVRLEESRAFRKSHGSLLVVAKDKEREAPKIEETPTTTTGTQYLD